MPYWLMKSEPDELSIHDLQRLGQARWDGVRNYQARNYLRAMNAGELFLFHHSSCAEPGIAGIGRISARPIPTRRQWPPRAPTSMPGRALKGTPGARVTWRSSKPFPPC